MPNLISYDFRCTDAQCGALEIELVDRGAVPEQLPCRACGEPAQRLTSSHVTKVSLVDGNGRFDSIRERRVVEREYKKAQRQGRRDDVKKLAKELATAGVKK
jgi:hypothetical protein